MKVAGKRIIVTGGGSGMGRELVLNLLSKGASVVAIDINEAALQETVKLAANNNSLSTYVADITNRAAVESLVEYSLSSYGSVDGLINNAGIIQPFIKVNELSYEAIERVMKVNFYGTLYMIKAFLPHLLTRPEAHILNVSSMGGFLPVPGQTIYGASKAAVKLLTEGLLSELTGTNVRVTIAFPGAIRTNIMHNSGLDQPSESAGSKQSAMMLEPAAAAQIMVDSMERNRSRVMVGKDAKFLDIFYRWRPAAAARFIYSKMKERLQ